MERIGRGGMASVYRARDSQLNRDVAVKVLASFDADDTTFVERFRREAQAVAGLNHPNIIQVHDFGDDKGFSYIVMEYVTGGTLEDRIGDRLTLPEVLELIGPVAEALAFAHSQGVVHRDMKPANVLLDAEDRPKLSDFGLARMLEGGTGLTQADSVLGTPEYMAPEQAMGRTADQRSDLYSLGIIVYRMLLGQTPFRGKTPSETLMAHVHQPLPLPSTVDPDIDPDIEATLVKVLAKDPDDRHQSPEELMQALGMVVSTPDADFESQQTIQEAVVAPVEPDDQAGTGTSEEAVKDGLSLAQTGVVAIRTAGESPGAYGPDLADVPMAFEVVSEEETEEHYIITFSFRPQGTFEGTPGQEQFFLDRGDGSVDHRQVLSLPASPTGSRIPMLPVVVGVAVVLVAAVVGVIVVNGGDGSGDEALRAVPAASEGVTPVPTESASAPAAAPVPAMVAGLQGGGTATIWDDQGLSDAVTYTMTGLAPAPAGMAYIGWLVSDDGFLKLSTGPLTLQPDGSIGHTVDHNSRGYTGTNLIHTFSKVVITMEEVRASFDTPLGAPLFSHQVPLEAMEHIRHLLTNWPPGSDRGILTSLKEQLEVAIFHATLAQGSNTMEDVRTHTEHVINIIERENGANYGDLDGNGVVENPGDGTGVLVHAIDRKHAIFAASEARDDATISAHASLVDSYGMNAEDLARQARNMALSVLSAEDIASAKAFFGPDGDAVSALLEAALNGREGAGQGGAVQAYLEA